jgi:hypothetical protein
MSVNRNVTVPVGGPVICSTASFRHPYYKAPALQETTIRVPRQFIVASSCAVLSRCCLMLFMLTIPPSLIGSRCFSRSANSTPVIYQPPKSQRHHMCFASGGVRRKIER